MWNVLSIIFQEYKIKILEDFPLFNNILFPQIVKKGKTNFNILLIDYFKKEPIFFVKTYLSKIFTKNRVKRILEVINYLENLNIPVIKPIAVFYLSPQKAYFKKKKFYGGIIYPFIENGFINKNKILEFKQKNIYEKFLENIIKFLFSLHEKGVFLRDTKYNNFWYNQETEVIKIFDLDGIKIFEKSLSKNLRLKDLSAFAMSLEWSLNQKQERKNIFSIYSKLYPCLNVKDLNLFEKYVEDRHVKRKRSRLKK